MRPLLSLVILFHVVQPYARAARRGLVAARDVIPAPIVVPTSSSWIGDDGPWSAMPIRVGSSGKSIRVFPSTSNQETWFVLPGGCVSGSPPTCTTDRGEIHNYNDSTSWANKGRFFIILNRELVTVNTTGDYGFDTVALGSGGQSGPSLTGQVVAGVSSYNNYVGLFGLTPKPVNFTDDKTPHPSFLGTLKARNLIPSASYGFSAGAGYRLRRAPLTLVLGGYDASRFTPNSISFPFAANDQVDLLVALRAVKATAGGSDTQLLQRSIIIEIDSSTPQIWLPTDACEKFEVYFGLIYDTTTNLYLVNDTLHDSLVKKNATITFSLANDLSSGPTVDIVFPYNAFDLTVQPPITKNTSSQYFPLRRALNDTQYRLGRTFLQEAYLIVDYERRNFSVSQTLFPENASPRVVPILNTTASSSSSAPAKSSKKGISGGAIGGIVVGVLLGFAIVGLLVWFLLRRRRRRHNKSSNRDTTPSPSEDDATAVGSVIAPSSPHTGSAWQETTENRSKIELDAKDTNLHEVPANEARGSRMIPPNQIALPDPRPKTIHELMGDNPSTSEIPSPDSERGDWIGSRAVSPLTMPLSPMTIADDGTLPLTSSPLPTPPLPTPPFEGPGSPTPKFK
ncbi:MAG: hypothetical protein M1814_001013 [Vezdaea aestivalis]|nr:MAG: hypothetical protein M1814_001013 [Vezdaea aestivalis]